MIAQDLGDYTLEYSGTAPTNQEFHFNGVAGTPGFLVTIQYQTPKPFYVTDDFGNPIAEQPYDPVTAGPSPPDEVCGSWRFEGAATNRLQFWMEPGCKIKIKQQEGVELGIRLQFTLEEFFNNGGITVFID
jgi:hypothetical protein